MLCILLGCRDGSGVACRIVVALLRGALVGREALDSWDVCTIYLAMNSMCFVALLFCVCACVYLMPLDDCHVQCTENNH